MSYENKQRAAFMLLAGGIYVLALTLLPYFHRLMHEACPCCNTEARPFDIISDLAGLMVAFTYRYLWQLTVLRWANKPPRQEKDTS
jgi:putative flippase GtrA